MMQLPLRTLGWGLNALGVAITITLGVWPDARSWFLDHAGLGWLLVIVLGLATAVLAQIIYHQRRSHAALASANDARLLAEWLGDWKQNSYITQFFNKGFYGFVIPTTVGLDVSNRVDRWRADGRQLSDPTLREKFCGVVTAAGAFWDSTSEMFIEDGTNGSRMEIPKEWKSTDRARYDAAYNSISDAGRALHRALIDLSAAMHERGLPT